MALEIAWGSISLAKLMHAIRGTILEIGKRKQIPVLIIDEANLLRIEVFAQLHTIGQFELDSKPLLAVILAGQNNLIDKLMYLTSRPLASRVIGRSQLEGLKQKDMEGYLKHHLELGGDTGAALLGRGDSCHSSGFGGTAEKGKPPGKGLALCRCTGEVHGRVCRACADGVNGDILAIRI
jgi:general secretion pathway protein A